MSKKKVNIGCQIPGVGLIGAICTTMIGQTIHNSFWWGFIDFLFWPLVWVKWLIYQDVTLSIIKESFSWFFK